MIETYSYKSASWYFYLKNFFLVLIILVCFVVHVNFNSPPHTHTQSSGFLFSSISVKAKYLINKLWIDPTSFFAKEDFYILSKISFLLFI